MDTAIIGVVVLIGALLVGLLVRSIADARRKLTRDRAASANDPWYQGY